MQEVFVKPHTYAGISVRKPGKRLSASGLRGGTAKCLARRGVLNKVCGEINARFIGQRSNSHMLANR
jgi:hypothetical protein